MGLRARWLGWRCHPKRRRPAAAERRALHNRCRGAPLPAPDESRRGLVLLPTPLRSFDRWPRRRQLDNRFPVPSPSHDRSSLADAHGARPLRRLRRLVRLRRDRAAHRTSARWARSPTSYSMGDWTRMRMWALAIGDRGARLQRHGGARLGRRRATRSTRRRACSGCRRSLGGLAVRLRHGAGFGLRQPRRWCALGGGNLKSLVVVGRARHQRAARRCAASPRVLRVNTRRPGRRRRSAVGSGPAVAARRAPRAGATPALAAGARRRASAVALVAWVLARREAAPRRRLARRRRHRRDRSSPCGGCRAGSATSPKHPETLEAAFLATDSQQHGVAELGRAGRLHARLADALQRPRRRR